MSESTRFCPTVRLLDNEGDDRGLFVCVGTGLQRLYVDEFVWHEGGRGISQVEIEEWAWTVEELPTPRTDELIFESHASGSLVSKCSCNPCERHRVRTAITERPRNIEADEDGSKR